MAPHERADNHDDRVAQARLALPAIAVSLMAPDFCEQAGEQVGMSPIELRETIEMSTEEARNALRVLSRHPLPVGRWLEVGSGPGVLAAALRQAGVELTTLEPGGLGIEHNRRLARLVMERTETFGPHLDIVAEQLDPASHGTFQLVFSHNVLEHVERLDVCLDAMIAVLAEGGAAVVHCPNYYIPYEPHYACWLLPFRPQWSRRLLSHRRLRDDAVWESLNFITPGDIRRAARRNACEVQFDTGELAVAFERVRSDPTFAARHKGLRVAQQAVSAFGLERILKAIPGQYASPMTVALRRRPRSDGGTSIPVA